MSAGKSSTPRPTERRPVLLAAVLAVLFGILGMHALNGQGAMTDPASAGAGHQMSSMRAAVGIVETAAVTAGEQAAHLGSSTAMAVPGPTGGARGPTGMLMLCLAMLLAGAVALAVVVRAGRPLRWLSRPRWSWSGGRPRRVVRGTGPPPTWEFSVIRC